MKQNTNDVYTSYLMEKGHIKAEIRTARPTKPFRVFPCTIWGRTFQTEDEYQEALADFLNGN